MNVDSGKRNRCVQTFCRQHSIWPKRKDGPLSMRKIADAIEYSAPVVYDHFENKEAILFEISLQGFKLLQKT